MRLLKLGVVLALLTYGCSDSVEPACSNGECVDVVIDSPDVSIDASDMASDSSMNTDVDVDASDMASDSSMNTDADVDASDMASDSSMNTDADVDASDVDASDMVSDSSMNTDADVDATDMATDDPTDASSDADANMDVGDADSGDADASMNPVGDCISGATGTHAVRFKWRGSQGSTAYVGYETNQLPDTSRWKVGAYGQNFNYRPVFEDTFLGIGGLALTSSNFIDVELSTVGISQVRNATIAILGRSFNTTAGGSFNWMSFDGSGAAPNGLVSNSAPYQWYSANATSAFAPGNAGILLRIKSGGPSNSLVVNSVEICFDAN